MNGCHGEEGERNFLQKVHREILEGGGHVLYLDCGSGSQLSDFIKIDTTSKEKIGPADLMYSMLYVINHIILYN